MSLIPTASFSDASWKPKSVQYSASSIPSVQTRTPSPARYPVIKPHSPSHQVSRPIPQYPSMPPPRPYSIPPPTTVLSSSNYDSAYPYPSTSSVSHAIPPPQPPAPSSSASHQPQYYSSTNSNQTVNGTLSSSYNYNYNYNTYNYNQSSTWTPPPYEAAPVDHPPQASYSAVNGGYDPYNTQVNGSMENGCNNSTGYDYGYDYNNYPPPNHPNNYQYANIPSNQYSPQSSSNLEGNMYSTDLGTVGGGYESNSPSYATLLPRTSISIPQTPYNTVAAPSSAPMEMDMTNTSTSDEPSLTHEDPQSLDSEENSSMSADDHVMEDESDAAGGGQSQQQLMFPECHWRQQSGSDPPISCQKPGCTEQFITHEQIRLHLLAHGEFQCNFCHLTFTKAHNLAHHEKMRHCKNAATGKSKCPRCSFTSTSQFKYFLHFLTYHLRISLYDKPCQICNKPFILGTKNINRKNHFRVYHDVEGKDPSTIFSCKGCSAQFLKEAQLRDHQPNCTSIASVSSVVSSVASSVEEITYNTALATADQIVV